MFVLDMDFKRDKETFRSQNSHSHDHRSECRFQTIRWVGFQMAEGLGRLGIYYFSLDHFFLLSSRKQNYLLGMVMMQIFNHFIISTTSTTTSSTAGGRSLFFSLMIFFCYFIIRLLFTFSSNTHHFEFFYSTSFQILLWNLSMRSRMFLQSFYKLNG